MDKPRWGDELLEMPFKDAADIILRNTIYGTTEKEQETKLKVKRILDLLGCSSVDDLLYKVLDNQIGYIPDYLKKPMENEALNKLASPHQMNLKIGFNRKWWKFVSK